MHANTGSVEWTEMLVEHNTIQNIAITINFFEYSLINIAIKCVMITLLECVYKYNTINNSIYII